MRAVGQGPRAAHGRGSHHVSPASVWRAGPARRSWRRCRPFPTSGLSGNGALPRSAPDSRPLVRLDCAVNHPVMGDIPCSQFLGMRVGDALLHAWDLARAIGTDDQLAPDLVVEVWTGMSPMAGFIGKSGFWLGTERRSRRRRTVAGSASRPFGSPPVKQRTSPTPIVGRVKFPADIDSVVASLNLNFKSGKRPRLPRLPLACRNSVKRRETVSLL